MLAELVARLKDIAARSDVRCVLLTASGPWFCAGMDLTQMQEAAARPDSSQIWHGDSELYLDTVQALFDLPMPTLAVVQGGAVAGGLGLVLACDMTIAAATATFALPEPKRGITAAVVTPLLVHRTGPGAAGVYPALGRSTRRPAAACSWASAMSLQNQFISIRVCLLWCGRFYPGLPARWKPPNDSFVLAS